MSPERSDVLTEEQRSFCMSRNRGRDTKPEMLLRKACWSVGLRYRLGSKVIGKPDLVLGRAKVAVFVDGCFWHGCPEHYKAPATRADFWLKKLQSNRMRDELVNTQLTAEGWTVVRIWEHTVKRDLSAAVEAVLQARQASNRVPSSSAKAVLT